MNWNSLQNSTYSFFGIWYFFPFFEFLFACVFKSSAAVSNVFLMAKDFLKSEGLIGSEYKNTLKYLEYRVLDFEIID